MARADKSNIDRSGLSLTPAANPSPRVYGPINVADNAFAIIGDVICTLEGEGLEYEDLVLKYADVKGQLDEWRSDLSFDDWGTGSSPLDYETDQNQRIIKDCMSRLTKHLGEAQKALQPHEVDSTASEGFRLSWFFQRTSSHHDDAAAKAPRDRAKLSEVVVLVEQYILKLQQRSKYARKLLVDAWKQQLGGEFSTIPQGDNHKQATLDRQEGTCRWVFNREEYRKWCDERDCDSLWIRGNAGIGKTTLTAAIINDLMGADDTVEGDDYCLLEGLNRQRSPGPESTHSPRAPDSQQTGIAYFYCNHTEDAKQTVSEVLGNFIAQLSLQSLPYRHIVAQFLSSERKSILTSSQARTRDYRDLLNLLRQSFAHFGRVYLVIDALDEFKTHNSSNINNKSFLVRQLQSLQQATDDQVKLLVTGRPVPDVQASLGDIKSLLVTSESNSEDIRLYLNRRFDDQKKNRCLWMDTLNQALIDGNDLQSEVVQLIVERADGMFLFAALQWTMLQKWTGRSAAALHQHVKDSPKTIHQTWKRLLLDIDESMGTSSDLVRKVLMWLVTATRPMTIDEVRAAISVQTYKAYTALESDLIDIDDLLDKCGPLVQYRQASGILSLVHFSLKEFLCSGILAQDQNPYLRNWNISLMNAHAELACISLTYLSSKDLASSYHTYAELKHRIQKYPLYAYSVLHGGLHLENLPSMEQESESMTDTLLTLLRHIFVPEIVWDDLNPVYTSDFGSDPLEITMTAILPQDKHDLPYQPNYLSITSGSRELAEKRQVVEPLVKDVMKHMLLRVSQRSASISWLQSFRQLSSITREDHPLFITPLYFASLFGWKCGVSILLAERSKVVVKSELHHALRAAAVGGHSEIIHMLQRAGARVDTNFGQLGSPLQSAAYSGQLASVETLLALGASAQEPGGFRRTGGSVGSALQGAALSQDKDMVDLLLKYGADLNDSSGWLGTPLQAVLERSFIDIGLFLISREGFDPNVLGGYYGSAARVTCEQHHTDLAILKAMFDRGLNLAERAGPYGSLLELTCHFGVFDKAEFILDRLENIGEEVGQFGHALHAAATRGEKRILEALLRRQKEVNISASWLGKNYATCNHRFPAALGKCLILMQGKGFVAYDHSEHLNGLYAPSLRNAFHIRHFAHNKIHVLFENEPTHRDGHLGTPLQCAAFRGHLDALTLLLNAGARLDAEAGMFGTALQAAVSQRHREAAKLLLEAGANPNITSSGHYGSALAAAIYHSFDDVFELLQEYNADLDAQDEHRWCARTWLKLCDKLPLTEQDESSRISACKRPSGWCARTSSPLVSISNDDLTITVPSDAFPSAHNHQDSCRCELPIPTTCFADHPVSPWEDFYFEIEIHCSADAPIVCIGVSEMDIPTFKLPGHSSPYWGHRAWGSCFHERNNSGKPWPNGSSWGYHGDDGMYFAEGNKHDFRWPTFRNGDIIGCGIELETDQLFFTRNGVRLDGQLRVPRKRLFPVVGIKTNNVSITANFGSSPFRFVEGDGASLEQVVTV